MLAYVLCPDLRPLSRQIKLLPCAPPKSLPTTKTFQTQRRGLSRHSWVSFSGKATAKNLQHAHMQHACNPQQVESKYGESISVKDITGRNPVKKRRGRTGALGDGGPRVAPADGYCAARLEEGGEATTSQQGEERQGIGAEPNVPSRRKAPTDSSNVAFEEWLRGRRPRDFLAEQVNIFIVQVV